MSTPEHHHQVPLLASEITRLVSDFDEMSSLLFGASPEDFSLEDMFILSFEEVEGGGAVTIGLGALECTPCVLRKKS